MVIPDITSPVCSIFIESMSQNFQQTIVDILCDKNLSYCFSTQNLVSILYFFDYKTEFFSFQNNPKI